MTLFTLEPRVNFAHVLNSTGLPDFPTPSLPNTATWTFLTLEVVPFFLLLTIGLLMGSRSLAVEYEHFSWKQLKDSHKDF